MSDAGVAAAAAAPTVDRTDFAMYVVTAADGAQDSGCLAGFVTQCSIEPSRFLVCISKLNHTATVARRSPALGLHLLGEDQLDLAAVFGELTADRADKLARAPWHRGQSGVPVLDECAAWLEGAVLERFDVGDHCCYLVEPTAGGGGGHRGWLPYSAARDLHPGHPAHERAEHQSPA